MGYIAIYFTFLLALSATLNFSHAQKYTITNTAPNTPGGSRYNREIGDQYTYKMLCSASDFIFRIFQQPNVGDRKNLQQVNLFIDDFVGYGIVAYASNNEIHYGARYVITNLVFDGPLCINFRFRYDNNILTLSIWPRNVRTLNDYHGDDVKGAFSGVIYHEMTHIWQWNGNGQAPSGLIEGIADFVRLRAGYIPSNWVQPGGGDKWDQGYDVTARFLDYCNGLRNGFVAQLNGKMRNGYSDQYFVDLLGKSVGQLFNDYKAKYGN